MRLLATKHRLGIFCLFLSATLVSSAALATASWAEAAFTSGSNETTATTRIVSGQTTTFHFENDHTVLSGTATGSHVFKFGTKYEVSCKSASFTGTINTVSREVEKLSLAPTYSECKFKGPEEELTAHIALNGCKSVLKAPGSATIECEKAENTIKIGVTIAGKEQECLSIPASGSGTSTYTSEGSGASRDIKAFASLSGLKYSWKGACGEGTLENGSYSGSMTLSGSKEGKSSGIWVETTGSVTLKVEGEETSISCNVPIGTGTTGTTAASLTAETPAESGCSYLGSTARTITNGCSYRFEAKKIAAGAGEFHIVCPEGKVMELQVYLIGKFRPCIDFPGQTPTVPNIDYTNATVVTGGKNVWDVTAKWTVSGIQYTKTNVCGSGTFDSTLMTAEATISGQNPEGQPVDVTWDSE